MAKNKKILLFFLWITFLIPLGSKANIAMPGFWSIGGSTGFVPIFLEDSLYLDKIQMQREEVHILLYKGFAVVKGQYYLKSLSDQNIRLKVGYPINSTFQDKNVYSVHFTDIYALQVFNDGLPQKAEKLAEGHSEVFKDVGVLESPENWYVWESEFKAGETHQITVYFIVNTNSGALLQGYSSDSNNGFTYLLESGKVWAKTIEQGSIHIHFMDQLNPKDILGIAPLKGFRLDKKNQRLLYEFTHLEPEPQNNILIRYSYRNEKFKIEPIVKKAEFYFRQIDEQQKAPLDKKNLLPFEASDFEVHDWKGTLGFTLAMFVMVFGLPTLVILAGIVALVTYIRRHKKR